MDLLGSTHRRRPSMLLNIGLMRTALWLSSQPSEMCRVGHVFEEPLDDDKATVLMVGVDYLYMDEDNDATTGIMQVDGDDDEDEDQDYNIKNDA
ncbi:hypothetical protein HAX54_021341 [Datura stramonium]|uniref:Uncharacterized protein n=1 Tax=Datura stramonium TaxID=4076 RepID=A0ABS8UTQ3_DATST|nr:hypothetical protein [Datura stramonium]